MQDHLKSMTSLSWFGAESDLFGKKHCELHYKGSQAKSQYRIVAGYRAPLRPLVRRTCCKSYMVRSRNLIFICKVWHPHVYSIPIRRGNEKQERWPDFPSGLCAWQKEATIRGSRQIRWTVEESSGEAHLKDFTGNLPTAN
jgi:hypothetical protein